MSGSVPWQAGRSCGVYCGSNGSNGSTGGKIKFDNCFVVARAGTVGNEYTTNKKDVTNTTIMNKRCAVFNINSANDAIKWNEAIIAGAAGYDSGTDTLGLLAVNEGLTNIYDYGDGTQATRTVIGLSKNESIPEGRITYDENIAATGVVIVPTEGWDWEHIKTAAQNYSEDTTITGKSTAIVTIDPNAVTVKSETARFRDGITIDTAGLKLAAVSLYEGTEDTAGIRLDSGNDSSYNGKVTFSGGGEVIAVGGMTNGDSYGINNPNETASGTTVKTALTAYGSTKTVVNEAGLEVEEPAFEAYPEGLARDGRLLKTHVGYPLHVDGKLVTSMNASDVLGNGTVYYNPTNTTLTLEDAAVSGIRSESLDLNLILKGTNAVSKDNATGHGIAVSDGNLTIEAGGENTVSTDANGKAGVWVDGSLTVNSSGFLTITATGDNGTGVQVPLDADKKIIINGGIFTASGARQAVSKAPDLTGYGDCIVTVSTDPSGRPPEDAYDEAAVNTYKYLHVESTYTISGTVKDRDTGAALAGASVQLIDSSGSVVGSDAVLQGANGAYAISNVRAGTGYTINATMADYLPYTTGIFAVSGDIIQDIMLAKEATPPVITGGSSAMAGVSYTGDTFPGTWERLPNGRLRLTVQADCAKFTSVVVDGVQLKADVDYELSCGSTILTFTPAYLASLKDGTHSIRVQFTDGRYTGSFTTPLSTAVTAVTDVPATGGAPFAWAVLLTALGLASVRRRRSVFATDGQRLHKR